jgi:protein ImuA
MLAPNPSRQSCLAALDARHARTFQPPAREAADWFGGFEKARQAAFQKPLVEAAPASPGETYAALGFSLAALRAQAEDGLLFWIAPGCAFAELGAPCADGLSQFGIDLSRLILVKTQSPGEALWATEQALSLPCARALCVIAPGRKSLGLAASRRLLLRAEESGAQCLLLRLDPLTPSAAFSRWRVSAAASQAAGREMGTPSFAVSLEKNRAGPAGMDWRVEWNAHEHDFREAPRLASAHARTLDGAVAAATRHRPFAAAGPHAA